MPSRTVVWRASAKHDLAGALVWYRQNASSGTAARLIGAVDDLDASIGDFPELGSYRYTQSASSSLRFRTVDGFPYLLFYVEIPDSNRIEILRMLHERRDIPRYLAAPADE